MTSKGLRFIVIFILISTFCFAQEKPNIVFFLVDDLGWKDLSSTGSDFYETPNIDKVIDEGIRFTNAYTAHPRCVPSRHAMMTGRFPARDRVPGGGHTEAGQITVAEALKEGGYSTFYAGKWHLGDHTPESWPQNQGFDVNKGGCGAGAPPSYFYPYNLPDTPEDKKIIGLEEGQPGEYITDRLTDETLDFIDSNNPKVSGKPFFACVAHYAVHTPIEAKADAIAKYQKKLVGMEFDGSEFTIGKDGKVKMHQNHPVYAAMVESVDESFGRIVQKLKELGIYENTIIVFTSDHGGLSNTGPENNRELATSNLPLRAGKGHCHEGGIKVPMFVRWPGNTEEGTTSDVVITGTDYYPTFLEMAGLPLLTDEHVDGVSFVPALKGQTQNTDRKFFWHSPLGRPESTGDRNCSVIRDGDFKLTHFYDENTLELFDLSNDPEEKNNLAESMPDKTSTMLKALFDWKDKVDAYEQHIPANSDFLLNPGFEEGKNKGWFINFRSADAKASLKNSPDAIMGNNAIRVDVETDGEKIFDVELTSDNVVNLDDVNHYISFYAKASQPGMQIKLQVKLNDGNDNYKYNSKQFTLTDEYQKFEYISKPKVDFISKSLSVKFQCGLNAGSYFIDEVYLTPPAKITSDPVDTAFVDALYEYQPETKGIGFFSLETSPQSDWLTIDSQTGRLRGTPQDTGTVEVRINFSTFEPTSSIQTYTLRITTPSDSGLVTHTPKLSLPDENLLIYPNPAKNLVYINNLKKYSEVKVVDMKGNILIYQKVSQIHRLGLDISSLKSGTYLIIVESESKKIIRKFVCQ